MKPKKLKATEEQDVEVVNRYPSNEERQQISLFIRNYKAKAKTVPTASIRQIKA